MVAIAEDRAFYPGDEYLVQSRKCIDSLLYGSMHSFYVKSVADIPPNHRIVLRNQSPYRKALQGFQKEEVYELCFGYFPEEIQQNLKGDGFSYTYQGKSVGVYVELKEDREECWEGILEINHTAHGNSLNLMKFRLAKAWVRDYSSSDSGYSGGEVGIGSWSDKGYY